MIRIDRSFLRDAASSVTSFGSIERIEASAILGLVDFERTGAVAVTGYVGVVRYLEVEGGMSRSEAHDRHRLIRHCVRFSLTASALESGEITVPYLRVLVSAAAGLADEYEADETELLGLAADRDVTTFERAVANWRNRAETAAGAADPARSFEQRGVSWQRAFDGSGRGQFSLDPIAMNILESALDTPPDPADGIEQPRTVRQRRADALTEAADHYVNGVDDGDGDPGESADDPEGETPSADTSSADTSSADTSSADTGTANAGARTPSGSADGARNANSGPSTVTPWGEPNGSTRGTKTTADVVVDLATLEGRAPETVAAIRAEFASG